MPDSSSQLIESTSLLLNNNEVESMSLKQVWSVAKISTPVILSYLLQASIPAISIYFLSHQGRTSLNLAALSNTIASVTGWSIALGLTSSLDTLLSQSYTCHSNPYHLGLLLQRGIFLGYTAFIPTIIFWYNSSWVLSNFLDLDLAAGCGNYLRVLSLGTGGYVGFECVKKFLQAQGIMRASTEILLIILPLTLVYNYILVSSPTYGIGYIGSAWSLVLTYWSMFLLSILYVILINGSKGWGGFDRDAFKGWFIMLKLGLPGVLMICCDWWAFEIVLLAATKLGRLELATHSIMVTLSQLNYMSFHGLSVATSNLIGNNLGLNLPFKARNSALSSMTLALILSTITSFTLFSFKNNIAHFFSNDEEIINNLIRLLPLVCVNQLVDGLATVTFGILRGLGHQHKGASVAVVAFYLFGLPIGLVLAFKFHFGLVGLWTGLTLSLATIAITLSILIGKTDWLKQANNVRERIGET